MHHLVAQQLPRALEGFPAGLAAKPPGADLRAGDERAGRLHFGGGAPRPRRRGPGEGSSTPGVRGELHQGRSLRPASSGRLGEERGLSPWSSPSHTCRAETCSSRPYPFIESLRCWLYPESTSRIRLLLTLSPAASPKLKSSLTPSEDACCLSGPPASVLDPQVGSPECAC